MRDDILMTLFGGGSADYDMLDKCNYDFENILRHIDSFTTREDMDFNIKKPIKEKIINR